MMEMKHAMEVRVCEERERAGGEDHKRPRVSRVFALFANLPQTPPRDILQYKTR
jgi:hypothetical protein